MVFCARSPPVTTAVNTPFEKSTLHQRRKVKHRVASFQNKLSVQASLLRRFPLCCASPRIRPIDGCELFVRAWGVGVLVCGAFGRLMFADGSRKIQPLRGCVTERAARSFQFFCEGASRNCSRERLPILHSGEGRYCGFVTPKKAGAIAFTEAAAACGSAFASACVAASASLQRCCKLFKRDLGCLAGRKPVQVR